MTGTAGRSASEWEKLKILRLNVRDVRSTIGRNIMRFRRVRRMRLQSLSKATGISVRKLDYWEMGGMEIDLYSLVRVADALDVPPGALVGGGAEGEARREKLYEYSEFIRELSESRNYDFTLPL